MSDEANIPTYWIHLGASALVKGGVRAADPHGDVLYDYDWTPNEASELVLATVAPVIRQQAIRDVVEAVRWQGPGHVRTVSKEQACHDLAEWIEGEFLPDTSPEEKR